MSQNEIQRVLLLVLFIVSLVGLDWERDRVYLLLSLASLSLVVWTELLRRRKIQKATAAEEPGAEPMVAPQTHLAYLPNPHDSQFLKIVESPVVHNPAVLNLIKARGEERT